MPYQIDDQIYRPDNPQFGKALEEAYAKRLRPLCLCKPGGLEVYIAHVGNQHIAKRMPGTGFKHDGKCEHFEAPLSVSGEGLVVGDAIQEFDNGLVKLRLDFALTKIAGRAPPMPSEKPAETAKADTTKLTMRGLLHYLWKESGLYKWQPGSAGKRSYGVFAKYTGLAAGNKFTRSQSLSEVLFTPRPSPNDPEQKELIRQQMNVQLSRAATDPSGVRRMGLVLGEVFQIEKASSVSYQLQLVCLLERSFRISEETHKRMVKAFDEQLSLWDRQHNRLILLATFYLDGAGTPTIQELTLMNVTRDEWLPFGSTYEAELIARLVESKRSFQRGLKFNLPKKAVIASCVLTDVEPSVALFVSAPGVDEQALEQQVKAAKDDQLGVWVWRGGAEVMPALPLAKWAN